MKNIITKFAIFFLVTITSFSAFESEINSLFDEENLEYGNTLIIEQELKVETIDPVLLRDTYSKRAMNYIYAQLFRVNKDNKIEPYLLSEYKYNDEMEMYCKLRDDIYFSNGDPITAQDVKISIEDYLAKGYMNTLYSSIKTIQVLSDKEFLILLNYPDNRLEVGLSNPLMSILKRVDNEIITSGSYVVEETYPNYIKLKRNEFYFEKDCFVENLEIKGELSSYQRVINSLNLHNYFSYDLYKEDIDTARKVGALKGKEVLSDTIYDIISLVFGKKKNYSLEERKALESLINRETTTIYPTEMFGKEASKLEKKYTKQEAVNILKKNGIYGSKIKIMCLNTVHNRNFVQYVAHDLLESGMDVEVEIYNQEKFLNKLRSKEYDIALYNITVNSIYPLTSLEKAIIGEIVDYELEDALKPFFHLYEKEKEREKKENIINKIFYLTYSSRCFVPLAHRQTYILRNR